MATEYRLLREVTTVQPVVVGLLATILAAQIAAMPPTADGLRERQGATVATDFARLETTVARQETTVATGVARQ